MLIICARRNAQKTYTQIRREHITGSYCMNDLPLFTKRCVFFSTLFPSHYFFPPVLFVCSSDSSCSLKILYYFYFSIHCQTAHTDRLSPLLQKKKKILTRSSAYNIFHYSIVHFSGILKRKKKLSFY